MQGWCHSCSKGHTTPELRAHCTQGGHFRTWVSITWAEVCSMHTCFHTEYKECPPTGHAICNICGLLASERAALEGLVDSASIELRKALAEKEAAHHAFHTEEYRRYELAVARATHVPEDLTTITIDAPTKKHQFDLPSQARSSV